VLIFSQGRAAKVRHVARNPKVALNFNSTADGGDVVVLIGEARVPRKPVPEARVKTYLRKYRQGIKDIGMTVPQFVADYAVPILITPKAMRGF
jgi:PPOX class probable F420-dependent enzyme